MSSVKYKLLTLVLLAGSLEARAASAPRGVKVDDLVGFAPLSIGDLVAKALVKADAPKYVRAVKKTPGVAVDDIVAEGSQTFEQLIERSNGVRRPAAAAVGVVSAKSVVAPIVTVTIPDQVDAEPLAVLAEPNAIATTPKVMTTATTALNAANTAAMALEISDVNGLLRFKPQTLVFAHAGSKAKIILSGTGFEGMSVFVRDQTVVTFDQKAMELTSQKNGVTEVYAVMRGKMYIVPVTVENGGAEWELKVPDALVSLDGVFRGNIGSALYPGLEQASGAPKTGAKAEDGPSLAESYDETTRTAREVATEENRYGSSPGETSYKPITIQVVDDRSAPAVGRVYPVSGAVVRLVGTEYAAKTDATGHLTIRDVPTNSHFIVKIDDGGGITRPGVAELSSRATQDGRVTRLKVIRNFSFDAYATLAGTGQQAGYASYCATVFGEGAEGARAQLENIAVSIDVQAEGPFFFNRYGFLDRALRATGPDGRFCYYNIIPGPMALSLFDDGALMATLPIANYPNRHLEEDLPIDQGKRLNVRLAAMGTAHEQLGSDMRIANSLKTIDMIDLIPLGTGDAMMQLAPGRVGTNNELTPHGDRLTVFAQAAEFEPSVYSFSTDGREGVVPLMPRGFVEDMSVYAQVAYNSELGVVLVEYGHGADTSPVTLRLVDIDGKDVGDGWYYNDQPVTKAVFFNVPAGSYASLVETNDGFWLGAETTTVYNETVSYVRLGSQVRYRP